MHLKNPSIMVLTNTYNDVPVWPPRGNLIAFIPKIDGDSNVFMIQFDEKDVSQLTTTRGDEAHWAGLLDGEQLLFASSRMRFKDEAPLTCDRSPAAKSSS